MSGAIVVEQLAHRYGARWAIRGLRFEVACGEIFGLLGPNGAGKTTTVKILTGQLTPTEGRARVDGLDVVADRAALGPRIGVTFERQNLYERLSVRENLEFFARLLNAAGDRIRTVLQEANLLDRERDVVSTLSRGLRQRLMIARALLGQPRVLFLDEPTSGLDPRAARDLRDWVRRLSGDGLTVLLTTHDMVEASELCRRVAIIDNGQLIALDEPSALVSRIAPSRLRVRFRHPDGQEAERLLAVDAADASRELAALQAVADVLEIHEVKASLADVFLQLTGHPLE